MPAFEITAVGTDQSDDRIIWVWSETEEWLTNSLKAVAHQSMNALHYNFALEPHQYDFIMPKDVQALHDRLRELAGIPRLAQMMRGADYMHPEHGRVTFVASDPDDGAYLLCKYWDTDKDEQAYFGCEASDLRFLPSGTRQRP